VPCTFLVRCVGARLGLLHSTQQGGDMDTKFIDEISRRTQELVANTPIEDVQKNMRALMSGWFSRLDLVTREELDVQQDVLRRTREKLALMEARVAELEQKLMKDNE
jgi:ubiquinone biosynthesis accessory factor UbiK